MDDIASLGLNEAWEVYEFNIELLDPHYALSRYGQSLRFDIHDYLEGRISVHPKTGTVLIRGRAYKSEDFYTELAGRKKLIKNWILENVAEDSLFTAR